MEGHPGFSLGHFPADPGGGGDDASAASHPHPLPVLYSQALCVIYVHLDKALTLDGPKAGRAQGHGAGIILIKDSAGGQHQRILLIGKLPGGHVFCGIKQGFSSCRVSHMHNRRSGMVRPRAGPLQALPSIQSSVGNPCKAGRKGGNLIHNLRRTHPLLRITHGLHEVNQNLRIRPHISGQRHRLPDALHSPLRIGKCSLLLRVAHRREYHIRVFCGLGHEQVLHRQEIQAFQSLYHMGGIRVGNHRVLAADVESLYLSLNGGGEDLCGGQSRLSRKGDAPGLLELLADGVIVHFLIARIVGGHGAHVAGTLDVVLSPERIHAAAALPQLSGDQRHVGHAHDALGAGGMLGDAQAVDDGRLLCPGIHPCCFPQHIRVDVADLPHLLRGIIPEDVPELFKAFRVLFDILRIGQSLLHHHVHHAVCEGHVGAGADLQVNVGVLRQGYLPGINDDQPGSILHGLPYLHAHHRVSLLGVRAHQKNAVHIMGYVIDRVGHGAGTQGFCQSRHACGVTDSGAVIRVVGPEAGTDHLLDQVNVFVGRTGTGKSRERFAAEGIFQLHESFCGIADGLLPGSLPEFTCLPVFDEGTGQPFRRMDKIKASGAPLDAQSPVVGRSIRRLAVYDSIVLHHQVHLTACGTVRTGGADLFYLPFPVLLPALQGQGPGGTGRRTIAAALAPGRFPVGPEGGFHDMEGAGAAALKGSVIGHFMAGADAGMTVDAFARVIGEIGIVLKNRHLLLNLHPGADRICLLHAVPVAQGLQAAVAVFCAAHAVQPVV